MQVRVKTSKLFTANYKANKPIVINQGGTSCFAGSQMVITSDGSKPINDVRQGDVVKCYNEQTAQDEWKPVVNTFKYENHKPTVRVKLKNGQTITATDDHKFYYEGGWVSLKKLLSLSLDFVQSWEYVDEPEVYDIEVQDCHNYYLDVGSEVLVHNSGKTYSILQVLIMLLSEKPDQVATVVGRDVPHLKGGAIRDFKNIWRSTQLFDRVIKRYNGTDNYAEFYNGSILEFKSFADSHDARGSRRDYAFINEANGISWEVVEQVMIRTRIRTFIDFNPTSRFWAHDNIMAKLPRDEWEFIKSTYKHNRFLEEKIVRGIEAWKDTDPYKWQVYGLGEIGRLEGGVYTDWDVVDEIPEASHFIAYGLDFGFSIDPAALIAVYRYDSCLYVKELVYEKGLINADLIAMMDGLGVSKSDLIVCDSAEPKSIEEIKRAGYYVKGVGKGADSIRMGIDLVKQHPIRVVRTSTNIQEELRNYVYKKDRDGKPVKPIDDYNHALDALRYVALEKLTNKKPLKLW